MILTVTYNPAVDQTMTFDEPLVAETVNRATDARFDAGGKGINVSQFLAGMDTETVATGLLGGFTGDFVTDQLQAAGIETAFVATDEPTRLNTTALADGTVDPETIVDTSFSVDDPDAAFDSFLESRTCKPMFTFAGT
mgnify:CR=1 FL=1